MGTRNLTAVQIDGAYKIAQYGQWDGYPSGQGKTALTFLRSMDRAAFAEKVRAARFLTDDDINLINAELKGSKTELQSNPTYGHLSRNTGAEILQVVNDRAPGILLQDEIAFANDSLFCEWAYVIDLDAGTFEIFKGFNKRGTKKGSRFRVEQPDVQGYYAVRLVKTYQLDALPTVDEFLAELEPAEEEA